MARNVPPDVSGSNRPPRRRRLVGVAPRPRHRRPSPRLEWLERRTLLATFLVSTTDDTGPGSLRQAILDANAAPGRDTIAFDLPPGDDPISPLRTIAPASPLPAITDAALVDGWSQPGFAGRPVVRLDGRSAGPVNGLTLTGSDIELRGLSVGGFAGAGVLIAGPRALRNWVHDNVIGVDPGIPYSTGNGLGVQIADGARDNVVGEAPGAPGGGNLIRGNATSFDLRVMPWGDGSEEGSEVPYESDGGRPLIIAGLDDNGLLHIRIYDRVGTFVETFERIVDGTLRLTSTNALGLAPVGIVEDVPVSNLPAARAQALASLKRRLPDLVEPYELSEAEKAQVLAEALLLIDQNREDGGIRVEDPRIDYRLGFPDDPVGLSRNWASMSYFAPYVQDGVLSTRWSASSSVFTQDLVPITGFSTSFLFQVGDSGSGFTFAIQRSGPTAMEQGWKFGSFGQEGIKNSAVITFDKQGVWGSPASRTGLFFNGEKATAARSTDLLPLGIDLNRWDRAFRADIRYADAALVVTITDTRSGASATQRYDVDLPAAIGGDTAYVGFTSRLDGLKFLAWEYTTTASSTTGNRLIGNVIEANGGPAIELGAGGLQGAAQGASDGPNRLQAAPVVAQTDAGMTGWLPGARAGASYRIDVYASASHGPGGAGEAARYLGHVDLVQASDDDLIFAIPFAAPAGLPILSATATDADGNTSGLTWRRNLDLALPALVRFAPGTRTVALGGYGVRPSLAGPGSGPLEAVATVELAVGAGTLSLAPRPSVEIVGQGTSVLRLRGPISRLDAILGDVVYAPPAGTALGRIELRARVETPGAAPIEAMAVVSDGRFVVSSAADAGPGTFRQAILDANAAPGGLNTIVFALPGSGPQRLIAASPWPALVNPTRIEATSSAVVLDGEASVAGVDVALAGVALGAFRLGAPGRVSTLVLDAGPVSVGPAGLATTYRITTAVPGRLTLTPDTSGLAARLTLRDAGGAVVATSDGTATGGSGLWVDMHLPPGTYTLDVSLAPGRGRLRLAAALASADAPLSASFRLYSSSIVEVADFNGDGRPDVLSDLPGGQLSVYLNNGDGSLRLHAPATVGRSSWTAPAVIAVADFNGDGRLDFASTNSADDTVSVVLGNGDGTFRPRVDLPAGLIPSGLTAADFDGDGRLDLACGHLEDQTVSVWLGNGDGTFRPRIDSDAGRTQTRVRSADFDGDDRADLVVWRELQAGYTEENPWGGVVSVLLGNGDGTFRDRSDFALGAGVLETVVGDFDGDGRADVASSARVMVGENLNYVLAVIPSNGDGTFRPPVVSQNGYYTQPEDLAAGDFNGDGRLDLAVANVGGALSVMLGQGDGSFPNRADFPLATGIIAAGDFDGDGRLDVFVTLYEDRIEAGTIRVLPGNGDGTLRPRDTATRLPPGTYADSVVTADLNGDGWTDLVAVGGASSTGQLVVYLGTGAGSFQLRSEMAFEGNLGTGLVADFNDDGRPDIAVTNGENSVYILLGNGDGTFRPRVEFATGKGVWGVVSGDFDGDGRLDLATANLYDKENGIAILLGNGDGTFRAPLGVAAGRVHERLTAADLNGDGVLDLAVPNLYGNTLTVVLGNGDGTFRPPVAYPVGNFPPMVTAADLNGDGAVDLVVMNQYVDSVNYGDDTVSVLLNNGDGTFLPRVDYPVTRSAYSLAVADFNGDGVVDLVTPSPSQSYDDPNRISVLLGNGDGTFRPRTEILSNEARRLAVGDFNNDGRPDVISNNLTVMLGKGDGSFSPRSDILAAGRPMPLAADLDGNGATDVVTLDSAGRILVRGGVKGSLATFLPPVDAAPGRPALDLAIVPDAAGPRLAAVDSGHDTVSLYAYGDGSLRLVDTLATGRLPAQVIAADLDGDGFNDLVVRNAVDGTLSVFFDNRSRIRGPVLGAMPPVYLPAQAVAVGPAVADVRAVDLEGSGRLDLVVVSQTGSQVLVLRNLGDRRFAAPVPYRAGAGPTWLDDGARVRGLDNVSAVAAARLTPGGPVSLMTANPGSNTLGVLAGLGGGRLANAVALPTSASARLIETADLDGDGLSDLVFLDAQGLAVALADGRGGFGPYARYDAGLDPTGFRVADVDGDGRLDLLTGNAYGDVLLLLGAGDGTFAPYRKADSAVTLAVADLDGDGKPEFVYANRDLDRVVVAHADAGAAVLADRSAGLLSPGAVKLADLDGDGLADLIVANSGSNNVLVYLGTGGGRFAPALNGNGFFVGTNPSAVAVADLDGDGKADLAVANAGSNDVSVLLGRGSGAAWTLARGPRIKTGAGPAAVAVGDLLGAGRQDLAVANREAGTVQVFPGVGNGFFDDRAPLTYAVGQAPGGLFVGNFDGRGTQLAALNAGSDTITLIGPGGPTRVVPSYGVSPTTGFAGDFNGDGLADLVVGNRASGTFALLLGGSSGLSLSQTSQSAAVPSPTGLSFAGVSGSLLTFYAATAGREAASLLAFNLDARDGGGSAAGPIAPTPGASDEGSSGGGVVAFRQVSQLPGLGGSALGLIAAVFTVAIAPGDAGGEGASDARGVELVANFLPPVNQPEGEAGDIEGSSGDGPSEAPAEHPEEPAGEALPTWEELAMGLEGAWEAARSGFLGMEAVEPEAPGARAEAASPAPPAASAADAAAVDAALEALAVDDAPAGRDPGPAELMSMPVRSAAGDGAAAGLLLAAALGERWARRRGVGGRRRVTLRRLSPGSAQ